MKHCVRHISTSINRSARRNIFLKATKMVDLARHTQQNFSSSTSCDLTSSSSSSSSSSSFSAEGLIQQFELQIMNQDKKCLFEISSSILPKWSTWHVISNKISPLPLPATLPPPLHLPPQMT